MKRFISLVMVLVLCLSLVACGDPQKKAYEEALALYEAGEYKAAMDAFTALGNYEAAAKYASRCQAGIPGCTIYFGVNQLGWKVIAVEDGKALLLCTRSYAYFTDDPAANRNGSFEIYGDKDWEHSAIRAWLNGEFVKEEFYTWEMYIAKTPIDNVSDMVFCLSAEEAQKYFTGNNDRRLFTHKQVEKLGWRYTGAYCNWWLRPTDGQYSYVDEDGRITAAEGDEYDVTMRPAMWIDLSVYMDINPSSSQSPDAPRS